MLQFILERYNYWIVIILMMTGLHIVFSRGNLVKKIIGLNIFQTSVFIFYITIGKIAGGTAPIFLGGHGDGGGHGDDHHGEAHDPAHADGVHPAEDHAGSSNIDTYGGDEKILNELHAQGGVAGSGAQGIDQATALPPDQSAGLHDKVTGQVSGISKSKLNDLLSSGGNTDDLDAVAEALPEAISDKITNSVLADAKAALEPSAGINLEVGTLEAAEALADELAHSTAGDLVPQGAHEVTTSHHGAETLTDVLYTNPLPHVLILTAIVVGVATTAVGLALAVRIREAYGTIEEDELEAADDIAEFGKASFAEEVQG